MPNKLCYWSITYGQQWLGTHDLNCWGFSNLWRNKCSTAFTVGSSQNKLLLMLFLCIFYPQDPAEQNNEKKKNAVDYLTEQRNQCSKCSLMHHIEGISQCVISLWGTKAIIGCYGSINEKSLIMLFGTRLLLCHWKQCPDQWWALREPIYYTEQDSIKIKVSLVIH